MEELLALTEVFLCDNYYVPMCYNKIFPLSYICWMSTRTRSHPSSKLKNVSLLLAFQRTATTSQKIMLLVPWSLTKDPYTSTASNVNISTFLYCNALLSLSNDTRGNVSAPQHREATTWACLWIKHNMCRQLNLKAQQANTMHVPTQTWSKRQSMCK